MLRAVVFKKLLSLGFRVPAIFSDISFDPQSRCGVAGILVLEDSKLSAFDDSLSVHLTYYQNIACTQLEISSVIAAMKVVNKEHLGKVSIYTDCKSAIDLPGRRAKLEAAGFITKAKGEEHAHAGLYREFFKLLDQTVPDFNWIKGHKPEADRSVIDSYFSLVDKACRTALRRYIAKV